MDLTDPTIPKLTGSCEVSSVSIRLNQALAGIFGVEGDYAFLVSRDLLGTLVVVDLHQRTNPTVVATKDFGRMLPFIPS